MKLKIILILLAFVTIVIFSRCYKCHPCVAKGESYNLPYTSGQNLIFINDSLFTKSFTVQTIYQLPPDEYCGRVGSDSYNYCTGSSNAIMSEITGGSVLMDITIEGNGGGDEVELILNKYIKVLNSEIGIIQNKVSTDYPHSSASVIKSININGKIYSNVFVFQKDTAFANDSDCVYFAYSTSAGLLKYRVKISNALVNWTLKNK